MEPVCTPAVRVIARLAAVLHQAQSGYELGQSSTPSSGSVPYVVPSEPRYVKLPERTVGMISSATGRVPTKTGRRGRPMIPHMTEVGQSGPPTRIETFAMSSPGRLRIRFMVRAVELFTPHAWRTPTLPAKKPPMNFCWRVHAKSLMQRQRPQVIPTDGQAPRKPVAVCGCSVPALMRMMPPVRYMGTPGTGGNRNRNMPTPTITSDTKMKPTISSSCVALSMPHSELSHERKTVTYLDTITFMIMKACPQKRAQQSTPSHFHVIA
mmetsp:Transcript_86597/g.244874  ORF Transcript_86597/g.244874 Transcript_86597/m.244874 type:complete len:266 (-) Transcript_86597:2147-2944(-)